MSTFVSVITIHSISANYIASLIQFGMRCFTSRATSKRAAKYAYWLDQDWVTVVYSLLPAPVESFLARWSAPDPASEWRLFYSTSSRHIDVTGNPPLCRACAQIVSEVQKFREWPLLCRNFARLRASAALGCYVCRILYNAEWTRSALVNSERQTFRQRLKDINPHLTEIRYQFVHRSRNHFTTECFCLKISAFDYKKRDLDVWELELLLVPEKGDNRLELELFRMLLMLI